MKLRDIKKMLTTNDGTRSLIESILPNEVLSAFNDWKKYVSSAVLIGGIALSYYAKPRYTQDIDYLFLSFNAIPDSVPGFKRTRDYAFQHDKTHVEIEVLTPESIEISTELAKKVYETAISNDGVKIASKEGLIALKLQRLEIQDKADIVTILKTGDVDLSEWSLSDEQMNEYTELKNIARKENG